ncbi:class I SAM-dependent methyltransferase [Streptomyces sp. SID12488]|uniref:class I SAM-dependent methyltransferase n=1 Tax=Streptomyces sp. SID12488 TaxID=2706040 RepID=UPI0013DA938C|nr:class I SAM-dependent methyltransferase [Streptomyces sp. SID12488]NEA63423.1 class I SAM-dependent methyltransferase [Streptomyces sp. SID12488]
MLRDTFDEAAELYDRARPRYPRALVDDLARAAGLGPGSRVLEIAPGTGQLSVPLAATGCRLTAVELGPSLAAVTRHNLRAFPSAEVTVADFEHWPLPPEPFDLAACATAFHWLDPAVRLPRIAQALRPGGLLALVTTHHVKGGTVDFFERVQRCYEQWDPATPPRLRHVDEADTSTDTGELDRSEHFDGVTVRRHAQDIAYSVDEYIDVLLTYSNHRALDAPSRHGLLTGIRDLIETRYDGRITKRYLYELIMATRVP